MKGEKNMQKKDISIRENILQMLETGPMNKEELLDSVIKKSGCTSQGFYKVLKKLCDDEIITLHKKTVSLSFFWIQNQFDRISQIANIYRAPVYQTYFGALKEGERIQYRFKTLRKLELFWVHSVLISVEGSPEHAYIMSLTPHDWFQNLRPDINVWWRKVTTGHPHWAVLTHATNSEMQQTQYSDVELFERMAGINPLRQAESTYINVVGDLIFEARFDARVVPMIQSFMKKKEADPAPILDMEGVYQLSVSRNSKKAKIIEKKLKKYFSVSLYSTNS
jgi:hypothetical protein